MKIFRTPPCPIVSQFFSDTPSLKFNFFSPPHMLKRFAHPFKCTPHKGTCTFIAIGNRYSHSTFYYYNLITDIREISAWVRILHDCSSYFFFRGFRIITFNVQILVRFHTEDNSFDFVWFFASYQGHGVQESCLQMLASIYLFYKTWMSESLFFLLISTGFSWEVLELSLIMQFCWKWTDSAFCIQICLKMLEMGRTGTISIVISLSISNKFEQNQMQNVDSVHFQQNPIISVWAVNGQSIVCLDVYYREGILLSMLQPHDHCATARSRH